MKRPPTTPYPFVAAPQANGSLSAFSRQYHHYQAFDALEFSRRDREDNYNWADQWESQVITRSYHTALIDVTSGRDYSYLALDRLADTVAHWALSSRSSDRIGLYRLSSVALIATALGLAKVGKHAVIFHDHETPERVATLSKRLGVKLLIGDAIAGVECHSAESILYATWPGPVSATYRSAVKPDDPAYILFTGNAEGRGKPILCSHRRVISTAVSFAQRIQLSADSRCFLPIAPSFAEALMIGVGTCFNRGATAVLADRNAIQRDPADWIHQVRQHQCTAMQYTEQLWRYASVIDASPHNDQLPLITVFGSGLDGDLHRQVVNRFNLKRVVEYFWAVDMPELALFNWTNTAGAMAYIPPEHADTDDVIIVDQQQQPVANGEPGELMVRIRDKRFRRYIDAKSYGQNIVTGLVHSGDRWWRSGAIVTRSDDGFFTYLKPVGQDFYWQGEAVCLARIKQVLFDIGWFNEVAIYPVDIPHHSAPGLMVSLFPKQTLFDLDLEELLMFMQAMLPEKSIPAFLRITRSAHDKTGNMTIPTEALAEKSFFFVEETDHFVLEEGQYQYINLKKLREFDENLVQIGMEPLHPELNIPTLVEAV